MIPIKITPHLDSLTVRLDIPALSAPHSEALARSLPTQFGYAFQEKILSGTATQINLPYQSWRHMLGMTERSYRIHLAFETHPKSKPSKAQMDAPYRMPTALILKWADRLTPAFEKFRAFQIFGLRLEASRSIVDRFASPILAMASPSLHQESSAPRAAHGKPWLFCATTMKAGLATA